VTRSTETALTPPCPTFRRLTLPNTTSGPGFCSFQPFYPPMVAKFGRLPI